MAESNNLRDRTSGGHLTDADYLDAHFEAMRPEYEQMLHQVGIAPGWTVFDAGCGGGSYLPLLAELVGASGRIVASDVAAENVRQVSHRIQNLKFICPVDVCVANVVALPFADASFDALWCAAVTQYLSDAEVRMTFREFKRVVKPGGLIAIKEADFTGFQFGPFSTTAILRCLTEMSARVGTDVVQGYAINPRGTVRSTEFAAMLRALGLERIASRTVLCERRHPLTSAERRFCRSVFSLMGELNPHLNLPDTEKEQWRALKHVDSPRHILHSEAFFYRELHNVTIGRVPA
ncbi:MAG: class I SAM-dependent methyltransferase [Candidatus Methylumidiphilus sp.]